MWTYPSLINNNNRVKIITPINNNNNNIIFNNDNFSNRLSPVLFVLDFDKTLAVYDSDGKLDPNAEFPSVYTRPFLYEFLDYIKSVTKNNIIILWTAGMFDYISRMLLLLNISQYFHHILFKNHCKESQKRTGYQKSYKYLINLFPIYKYLRSILIDDLANWNVDKYNDKINYFRIISVKPFNIKDVRRFFFKSTTSSNNIREDTTLLNVINYLDKKLFFSNNDDDDICNVNKEDVKIIKYKLYLDCKNLLSISNCDNNNNDDDDNIPILYSIF